MLVGLLDAKLVPTRTEMIRFLDEAFRTATSSEANASILARAMS